MTSEVISSNKRVLFLHLYGTKIDRLTDALLEL